MELLAPAVIMLRVTYLFPAQCRGRRWCSGPCCSYTSVHVPPSPTYLWFSERVWKQSQSLPPHYQLLRCVTGNLVQRAHWTISAERAKSVFFCKRGEKKTLPLYKGRHPTSINRALIWKWEMGGYPAPHWNSCSGCCFLPVGFRI